MCGQLRHPVETNNRAHQYHGKRAQNALLLWCLIDHNGCPVLIFEEIIADDATALQDAPNSHSYWMH